MSGTMGGAEKNEAYGICEDEMTERILELARELCGAEEGDPLLAALCRAAETAWTARLKRGVTPVDCGEVFLCAAAFTAAADHLAGQCGGSVESFTAGELSIKKRSGWNDSEAMRKIAERLMVPYVAEERFAFKGVRG